MIDFNHEEAIARPGSFSAYDMMAVYPTISKIPKTGLYLEIGVQHGRSLTFAREWSKGRVVGVDIDENHDFDERLKNYDNWEFLRGNANEVVKSWKRKIDVLFIDGDHTYEGVKKDWEAWSPFVKKGGIVFFHDCDDTSPGVRQLWDEIDKEKGLSRDTLDDRNTSMSWVKM